MRILLQAFWPVIPIFFVSICFLLVLALILNKRFDYEINTYKKLKDFIVFIGVMMSVIGILLITMMPTSLEGHTLNLIPFQTIRELYYYGTDEAIVNNIGMNIVLFIPFGFFVYLLIQKEFLSTVLGCLFSILIETMQYILPIGRTSNIDDVILNTTGTIIGVVAAFFFIKLSIFIYYYVGRDKS